MDNVVAQYLDDLDNQREAAFSALSGIPDQQIWRRPSPREWCLGEILDHNYLLINSFHPLVKLAWRTQKRRAERNRHRSYKTFIEDPYRKSSFPMWVGFLWRPRYSPGKPTALGQLEKQMLDLHHDIRIFYSDKDPALLGNVYLYDPLFGFINLIITLQIGIYHDQLHYDDVFKLAGAMKLERINLPGNTER